MLNTGATIKLYVFLNLRLSLAVSRLVNWHLDVFIEIGNNDRSQSREFCMEHLVINRPKPMEIKHLLIPGSCSFHFSIRLVSYAMINEQKIWRLESCNLVEWLSEEMLLETWQEQSLVVISLNKSVSGISICFDSR